MTPEPKVKGKTDEERWVLGSSLHPDERRYVLELFPESRRTLGMTDAQWLGQIEFLVKKDGSLDLRKRYCRLPAVPGEPDRRFHRAPRYEPLPAPPSRQEQREQQQPDPPPSQLPPEPRPSRPAEGQPYPQRVYAAYQALAAETQYTDVPIHALHRRVGGDIRDLHAFLREECFGHRVVATVGEPLYAGDAALMSALTIPGQTDRETGRPVIFLNIKLIEPRPMQEPPPDAAQQTAPQPELGRRLTRDDLDVIIEALEYRCDAIAGGTDFDEVARLKSIGATLEKLRTLEAQPQRPEHERYERLLRATAALRYPTQERTAELEVRIEKTIARKVQDFLQEQQMRERVRLYEHNLRQQLDERRATLRPAQVAHYEQKIDDMVKAFRAAQGQQQQQAPPPPARSQEQGRGLEQSL
jgi:hypothetical protein